jgi:hypothetical protein
MTNINDKLHDCSKHHNYKFQRDSSWILSPPTTFDKFKYIYKLYYWEFLLMLDSLHVTTTHNTSILKSGFISWPTAHYEEHHKNQIDHSNQVFPQQAINKDWTTTTLRKKQIHSILTSPLLSPSCSLHTQTPERAHSFLWIQQTNSRNLTQIQWSKQIQERNKESKIFTFNTTFKYLLKTAFSIQQQ